MRSKTKVIKNKNFVEQEILGESPDKSPRKTPKGLNLLAVVNKELREKKEQHREAIESAISSSIGNRMKNWQAKNPSSNAQLSRHVGKGSFNEFSSNLTKLKRITAYEVYIGVRKSDDAYYTTFRDIKINYEFGCLEFPATSHEPAKVTFYSVNSKKASIDHSK
ncbi:MAG: hypothetical protein J0H68_02160 [Sphingobacteriia bacterium]|nr:hypothetical protein [Sphingobacteriia bacterium]